jgi:hypothetical protein
VKRVNVTFLLHLELACLAAGHFNFQSKAKDFLGQDGFKNLIIQVTVTELRQSRFAIVGMLFNRFFSVADWAHGFKKPILQHSRYLFDCQKNVTFSLRRRASTPIFKALPIERFFISPMKLALSSAFRESWHSSCYFHLDLRQRNSPESVC